MFVIVVNGHKDRLVKDLREAADKLAGGQFAFIEAETGDGRAEIQFQNDTTEFSPATTPYIETEDTED